MKTHCPTVEQGQQLEVFIPGQKHCKVHEWWYGCIYVGNGCWVHWGWVLNVWNIGYMVSVLTYIYFLASLYIDEEGISVRSMRIGLKQLWGINDDIF